MSKVVPELMTSKLRVAYFPGCASQAPLEILTFKYFIVFIFLYAYFNTLEEKGSSSFIPFNISGFFFIFLLICVYLLSTVSGVIIESTVTFR